ncbi:hypothetical protein HLH26_01695 [Gluconacetobacter sp. 1b LMG 1731]|uniref:Uncharacterized protein n=1 Tax=Gluconacetobacter dulcium TaxID=2729096 RepID=A0A7W4IIH3_9PROT|nr:hypothetical protein [Gluconacetobacter dulcium]MBB2163262.1 hypothetical protein [Gluconacetobacter dulcium]MBB2192043.1 hypothetical protein [Gluconacetobacter dulcium]MBB2197637.1 hypothetical protein [Gluconacetobacter dulcium]
MNAPPPARTNAEHRRSQPPSYARLLQSREEITHPDNEEETVRHAGNKKAGQVNTWPASFSRTNASAGSLSEPT